jgi:hypothetical protein
MTMTYGLRSWMRRKSHVQFCNGGGAGDCSTDRNQPTAFARRESSLLAINRSGR